MEQYAEDCKVLLSELKQQENALRIKRRWLMDLPLSEGEQKRMKETNPFLDKRVPETLLREDDIYYDKIRTFVEGGFGIQHLLKKQHMIQENFRLLDSCDRLSILSLLDKMTNKGLLSFAELVTEGMVEHEKTRSKMKKIIKQYLLTFVNEKHDDFKTRKEKISSLLKDPENFLGNHAGLCTPTESFRAAAIKVLDKLEELPNQTLNAMNRKLKGQRGYIPRLEHKKCPPKCDLIVPVTKRCMKMLLELDEGKEPQEALAKALAVASLTLKLILGHPFETKFQKFPPEIEALQYDIAKAIRLINGEGKFSPADIKAILKKFQHPSDPKVDFKNSSRFVLRTLLFEYLFECCDMDIIPESLIEALSDIKKRSKPSSCKSDLREAVEEEVEFLLCLSAQTKQIVWDSLDQQEFDQDFANAYMEDLEESEDDGEEGVDLPPNFKYHLYNDSKLTESIDETCPITSESPISTCKRDGASELLSPNRRLNVKLETMDINERDSVSYDFTDYSYCPESKMFDSAQNINGSEQQSQSSEKFARTNRPPVILTVNRNGSLPIPDHISEHGIKRQETENDSVTIDLSYLGSLYGECGISNHKQCAGGNQYLSIQKACDETTMMVYCMIGHLLHALAQAQHVNLRHGDVSYLQSWALVPNNPKVSEEKKSSSGDDICNLLLVHVLEELMPTFSESIKTRLKSLMGLI